MPPHRDKVRRVILCTGKIYYELADERRAPQGRHDGDHAHRAALSDLGARPGAARSTPTPQAEEVVWVQEEPANMGAQPLHLRAAAARWPGIAACTSVARAESASPATGSHKAHLSSSSAIVNQAFAPVDQLG